MLSWFAQLSFAQLSWLSVIIYILHYAEEGPRLVEWFQKHYTGRMANKLNYTQKKLNLENALLFAFTLILVIIFNLYPDNLILRTLAFGSSVGFVGNTIFHAMPTLRTGIYSPGVVTASMFNPPVLLIYNLYLEDERGRYAEFADHYRRPSGRNYYTADFCKFDSQRSAA